MVYRWFCRLDLDDAVPDHSSFSKNRRGHFRDGDLLRDVFERVVEISLTVGLIRRRTLCGDDVGDSAIYHNGRLPALRIKKRQ